MSFLTYETTRPWAKAIKEAVRLRKMPPWFADPKIGHFVNDRSLRQSDVDTLAKWADGGAPRGNPKDAPPPVEWPKGWHIQPDVIVEGPAYGVPANPKNNVVEWITVTVPSGFTTDTWITSVEIRPEYPEVTHHICLGFNPHTPDVKYFVPYWKDKERGEDGSALPNKGPTFTGGGGVKPGLRAAEDCYVPGNVAIDYRPLHAAKLVPAGSDITLNLHYTPNGKAVTDHVRIGFTIAKEAPERRYLSFLRQATTDPKRFAIPPNDPNWACPPVEVTFARNVELVFMMPHMHARGKDMTYTLEYPDGRKEAILHVPRYDFNWQIGYETSIPVPKGTKLRVDAHFDNSVNNPSNPDPNRTVYYGEMTWEEMMAPFFSVVVDRDADPKNILAGPRPPSN
ncbi:MAG: thiol-disulfide isomerase [Bryobacterales bacterium]|nr:thiol-disulfide isomerase [Bryobacterales bacterium]